MKYELRWLFSELHFNSDSSLNKCLSLVCRSLPTSGKTSQHDAWALQAALSDEVEWRSQLETRPRPRRLQAWVFTPWRSPDLYHEGDFSLLLFEWCQTETFSSIGGLLDFSVFLDFLWLSLTNCSFLDPVWASIMVFQPGQRSRAFARHDLELVMYKNM